MKIYSNCSLSETRRDRKFLLIPLGVDSYMYNFILQFKVYNDNDKCKQAMFYVNDSQIKFYRCS